MTSPSAARWKRARRVCAAALLCGVLPWWAGCSQAPEQPVLRSEGVGVGEDGPIALLPGADVPLVPGSRVLADRVDPKRAAEQARSQARWLAASRPNRLTKFDGLRRDALLDLYALTLPSGAVLASAYGAWAHVWPRDASFAAAAYAASGHHEDATRVLSFLQELQGTDGLFEARYNADGTPVDDGRAPQLDGSGWVLWALDAVAAAEPDAAPDVESQFRPLLDRSSAAILRSIGADGLPHASSDYWEHRESVVTLGTVAPLLAGLQAATRCYERAGHARPDVAAAAQSLRAAIVHRFGPTGYGRYPGLSTPDAAIAFLQPPFVTDPLPGAWRALESARTALSEPGGGLSPGAAWRDDGVSWTPETAAFGLALAAHGEDSTDRDAREVLTWLSRHATRRGALPEKVRADGQPASVAPLAWTDALTVLILSEANAS